MTEDNNIIKKPNSEIVQDSPLLSHRNKIKKFIRHIVAGQEKTEALEEIFPETETWSKTKKWRHINLILLRHANDDTLIKYKNDWLNLCDQKKVDMLLLLEQQYLYNKNMNDSLRLKAIDTYIKILSNNNNPIIQNINIHESEKEVKSKLQNIFGIKEEEIIDVNPNNI